MNDKLNRIACADALDYLRELPDGCVNCCVTSPPYWGLRDYGVDGQIGLETTFDEYIDLMTALFAEVKRVLVEKGTLWMNMGDAYAGSWGAQGRKHGGKHANNISALSANQFKAAQIRESGTKSIARTPGLKPKDLIGMPWRVAFALQADGWYLRQDIIWAKPNPMPESVRDRCTRAHEYLFMFAKSAHYYYDFDAMQEPAAGTAHPRGDGMNPKALHNNSRRERVKPEHKSGPTVERNGIRPLPEEDISNRVGRAPCGKNSRMNVSRCGNAPQSRQNESFSAAVRGLTLTRNRRSVWTIPSARCSDAHFATFPPALVEPCIRAGCPADGVVLDPFMGSGTTALVAVSLGRKFLGCDLNPEYVAMAERRLHNEVGLLLEANE